MLKISSWISLACLTCWVIYIALVFALGEEGPPSGEDLAYIFWISGGVLLGSFALSYLGGHVLRANRGALRLGAVVSIIWVAGNLAVMEPYTRAYYWSDFIWIGLMPIVLYWGVLWVIMGFRSSADKRRGNEGENQEGT